MKQIVEFYNEQWDKRLMTFLAVALVVSMPLSIRINSIVIVIAMLICIALTIRQGKIDYSFLKSPAFVLGILQLIILVVGLIYSSDRLQGFADLERGGFILAFLIIIYQIRKASVTAFTLIATFSICCLVTTMIALGYVLFVTSSTISRTVFESGPTDFIDFLRIHPTYLSIYLVFIFYFLLETLRTRKNRLNTALKAGASIGLVYIILILIYVRSQMGLIIFATLLIAYIVILLKSRARLVAFVLLTVGLLVFLLDSNRVPTLFDTYGRNVSSALDQRISVWRGTIEGIKTSPFFGAGSGGEQLLINRGYAKTGYQEGIANSYNAHNQYLQFLARNGMLELGCFFALLFYCFYQSFKTHNFIFFMFIMATALVMLAESFLNVQRGIVFFYFFLLIFIYLPYEKLNPAAEEID